MWVWLRSASIWWSLLVCDARAATWMPHGCTARRSRSVPTLSISSIWPRSWHRLKWKSHNAQWHLNLRTLASNGAKISKINKTPGMLAWLLQILQFQIVFNNKSECGQECTSLGSNSRKVNPTIGREDIPSKHTWFGLSLTTVPNYWQMNIVGSPKTVKEMSLGNNNFPKKIIIVLNPNTCSQPKEEKCYCGCLPAALCGSVCLEYFLAFSWHYTGKHSNILLRPAPIRRLHHR